MPLMQNSKDRLRARIAWLRKLAGSLVSGRDVEDLVQETIIRTEQTDSDRIIVAPNAYARQVARNLVIDGARSAQARGGNALPLDDIDAASTSWVAPDQESALLLKQVILSLPPIYRDTFILNRFMGFTYVEIAQRYGITTKAVEYRMSRALALCQEALSD